jgi:hypothetical protein
MRDGRPVTVVAVLGKTVSSFSLPASGFVVVVLETATVCAYEVPACQDKSKDSKAVSHVCVSAGVDLPSAPEGDNGGDDHESSAEGVHGCVGAGPDVLMAPKREEAMD